METVKRSVVARSWGGWRDEKMEHRGFLGQTTLYEARMVETRLIRLSRPIGSTTSRVNPSVNHGLWVMMMCVSRFTYCNKGTISRAC